MIKSQSYKKYIKEAVPALSKKFGYKNKMAVPKITKVVLNSGIGKFIKEKDALDETKSIFAQISGQSPVFTKARKSISGFKVRAGQVIGIKVTLRGERMWQFIDRFVGAVLPRVRDFQGIDKKSIDENGNLNVAIKEHIVFPEISPEGVKNIIGLQVTFVSTAKSRQEGEMLLKLIGFPIKK